MKKLNIFPLAPFFAFLRRDGFQVSLSDYRRIQRALLAGGKWSVPQLQDVLSTLLCQSPEQQELFRRRFDSFFPQRSVSRLQPIDLPSALRDLRHLTGLTPVPLPPGPPSSSALRAWLEQFRLWHRKSWRRWAALLLAVFAAAFLVWRLSRPPDSGSDTNNGLVDLATPTPVPEQATRVYPRVPVVAQVEALVEPAGASWSIGAVLSAFLALVSISFLFGIRRLSRLPDDHPLEWNDDAPGSFPPEAIGGEPAPWLDRETLDLLADSLGYFQAEEPGRELDVAGTVEATAHNGGIPTLVFSRRRLVRRVLVLEDAFAEPRRWNRLPSELAAGLQKRGIAVLHGSFRGVPDRFRTPDGFEYRMEDLEDERGGYLLLLFSDGKGLRHRRDGFVLENLSCWPAAMWMELRERRAWDGSAALPARFGLPVFPATRDGLLEAFGRFTTERGDAKEVFERSEAWRGLPWRRRGMALAPYIESLLGDSLLWAQACAMVTQPLSLGLADELRRRFHPELPPERIERLFTLPGSTKSAAGVRLSDPVLAVLRAGFAVRRSEAEQKAVLEAILEQIRRAEPPLAPDGRPGLDHHGWEWRLERVRLELEPDRALRRLAQLEQGPLRGSVRQELAKVTIAAELPDPEAPDDATVPLRLKPVTRRGLQRLDRLADRSGVEPAEAYPVASRHKVILGILLAGTLLSALSALRLYPFATATVAMEFQLEEGAEVWTQLTMRSGEVWEEVETAQVRSGTRWSVERSREYRLNLFGGGLATSQELGMVNDGVGVVIEYERRELPCRQESDKGRWVLRRCPPSHREGRYVDAFAAFPKADPRPPSWLLRVGLQVGDASPTDRSVEMSGGQGGGGGEADGDAEFERVAEVVMPSEQGSLDKGLGSVLSELGLSLEELLWWCRAIDLSVTTRGPVREASELDPVKRRLIRLWAPWLDRGRLIVWSTSGAPVPESVLASLAENAKLARGRAFGEIVYLKTAYDVLQEIQPFAQALEVVAQAHQRTAQNSPQLLANPDWAIRLLELGVRAQRGRWARRDLLEAAARLRKDSDAWVRVTAAQALQHSAVTAVTVPALLSALQDESQPVVLTSVVALGNLGPAAIEATPALKLLASENPPLQAEVEASLQSIETLREAPAESVPD